MIKSLELFLMFLQFLSSIRFQIKLQCLKFIKRKNMSSEFSSPSPNHTFIPLALEFCPFSSSDIIQVLRIAFGKRALKTFCFTYQQHMASD